MTSKPALVITSINPPTPAVEQFGHMDAFDVIMVGDKKTPAEWQCQGVTYLSPSDQESLPHTLIPLVPWNRPARANIGYLHAMSKGAPYIVQCDDDNIPNEHWAIPAFEGTFDTVAETPFANIYTLFTDTFVWPRGYPLDRILSEQKLTTTEAPHRIGVWQHLADKDTDVDAIYRLTRNQHVTFTQRPPVVLAPGTICPFNCQSTTFAKEAFPLLYLPVTITPRASDIVRGLVAQPILAKHGLALGFTAPTVYQERNPHNYLRDFAEEILIYQHSERIVTFVRESLVPTASLPEDMTHAYERLVREGIVPQEELTALGAWLADVNRILTNSTLS